MTINNNESQLVISAVSTGLLATNNNDPLFHGGVQSRMNGYQEWRGTSATTVICWWLTCISGGPSNYSVPWLARGVPSRLPEKIRMLFLDQKKHPYTLKSGMFTDPLFGWLVTWPSSAVAEQQLLGSCPPHRDTSVACLSALECLEKRPGILRNPLQRDLLVGEPSNWWNISGRLHLRVSWK